MKTWLPWCLSSAVLVVSGCRSTTPPGPTGRNKGVRTGRNKGGRIKGVRRKQRCQESLFGSFRTLGRPRGRSVDSRSRRRTVDSTHVSLPKGLPRLTLQRTASTSLSLSGSLTRLTQFGSLGSGHADNNLGSGSGWVVQRYNDPHRQSSARSTKSARTAFRSTYRATTKKCSSSWMGKLLNRPWYKCPCPEVP